MTKVNRTNQQLADQTLLAGIQGNPQSFPLLVVGGKTVTVADAIAVLQARVDATNRVATTRAAWQEAMKAEEDERADTRAVVTGVRRGLQAAFDDSPETLGKYGLKPRKAPAVPVHVRVAAAAKAKATRAARHTMGSKQKQAVKGDVTDVVITPVTASTSSQPAAIGATTAPASAAAAASSAPSAPAGTTAPATPSAPAKLG
jgi:hypothetical protein